MAANMYDQAALALFINTYAPINFGEIYRIGAAQKAEMDRAAEQFTSLLQKFGEFRSPSVADTKKYYDLTTGRKDFQEAITNMVSNPDYMKDASNRANLQSLINSVDYSNLSMLRQSAENLDARLKMVALMKAQGKYNPNWDDLDISNYDTIGTGKIMTDLAPLEWMNANQLSNTYFDNLKPTALNSVYKDGVKYQRQGITYDTLKGIADAKFNDLVSTPQGQMYYRDALKLAGGDEAAAKEAFTTMIADSQRDRIVEQETVDPAWLANIKNSYRSSGKGTEIVTPNPTRLHFMNAGIFESATAKLGSRSGNYRDYIASLVDKYPNTKIAEDAKKGLKNIDTMTSGAQYWSDAYNQFQQAYMLTGDERYALAARQAEYKANDNINKMLNLSSKYILRDEFKRVAGYDPINLDKNASHSDKGYMKGVKASLDIITSPLAILKNDDLLTGIGGLYNLIRDENGSVKDTYNFNNSSGFLMPETVFLMVTLTSPRKVERSSGLLRSGEFPLKELIESGQLNDVKYIPENKMVKIGGNFALQGKIRIPKETIELQLGTGLWSNKGITGGGTDIVVAPFGRKSTKVSIEELFGGRKVTEKVDKDGIEYYELDTYKVLPNEETSPEYFQRVNQRWQGGSDTGIGGATQAKEEYGTSAEQLLR